MRRAGLGFEPDDRVEVVESNVFPFGMLSVRVFGVIVTVTPDPYAMRSVIVNLDSGEQRAYEASMLRRVDVIEWLAELA